MKAMDYHTYQRINQSARYNDDVAPELHRMAKLTAVQMKDTTLSPKDLISVTDFLQDFKSVCVASEVHVGAALWLLKQYLTRPAKVGFKSRMALPKSVNTDQEGTLRMYSEVVSFLLKRGATDDNIAKLDGEVRSLKLGTLPPMVFAQQLWSKKLACRSV